MGDTQTHLAAWEAAGLIDPATADRIRALEAAAPAPADASAPTSPPERSTSPIAQIFGPGISIGEMFGYLGALFMLAATDAFLIRIAGSGSDKAILAVGTGIQAVALLAIGYGLHRGDRRRQRAAGVAFLFAVIHAGAAGGLAWEAAGVGWPASGVMASVAALGVAIVARLIHPALLTQTAVLGSVTCFSGTVLVWLEQTLFPSPTFVSGESAASGVDPLLLTVSSAIWWLLTGIGIGVIGLWEATRAGGNASAGRRAGLSRLWAGFVAISGFAAAVTRSDIMTGEYGRVIEPWLADVAILVVAAILVERAFRRDANAFIYPAALGVIIALTDFNFSYLANDTDVGLFVEGLILLAVGVAAQRLRRLIGSPPNETSDPHERAHDPPTVTPAEAHDVP